MEKDDVSENTTVVFSSTTSLTQTFNPNMFDYLSSDTQLCDGNDEDFSAKRLQKCLDILDENLKSKISDDIKLYETLVPEPSKKLVNGNVGDIRDFVQNNESNEIHYPLDYHMNYNNIIESCNICHKNQVQRYHTCKQCLDGYGLKEVHECTIIPHKRTERCYDRTVYSTKSDRRCDRIKYRYCKCLVNVSFGLCLFGFLLVVIGTGLCGGCWVYLTYKADKICQRSNYLHFYWYIVYMINLIMFIFTIFVIIVLSKSSSRNASCSFIKSPGTGKNCSIVILFIIIIQCFVWIFIFAVGFFIGSEMYLLRSSSKAFCAVININLNYTNIGPQEFTLRTLHLIYLSDIGALTVILGLIFIIIGVSMNYQKMKSALGNELIDITLPSKRKYVH